MTVDIIIDFNQVENFEGVVGENNNFIISFKSFEEYLNYLQSPKPFTNYLNSIYTSKEELKLFNYINKNLDKFVLLLKSAKIKVENLTNPNLDISLLPNQEMEFYLSNLSYEDTKKLLSLWDWPNTTFQDRFNTLHNLTKDELLSSYQIIDEIIKTIKSFNLTPAENAFVAFDIARSRIYQNCDNDDPALPRDLSYILSTDNIVCSGYANLFCCLCSALGIYAENIYWNSYDPNGSGHASAIAFIVDPKYNINGIYAFEPTWSSKKNENDTTYLNNTFQAFIPIDLEISRKDSQQLGDIQSNLYCRLKNNIERYEKLIKLSAPEFILEESERIILTCLKEIYTLLNRSHKRLPKKKRLEFIKNIFNSLGCSIENNIPLETFEELLKNVRTVENAIDPTNYPFDEEILRKSLITSVSYRFSVQERILLKRILESK